MKKLYTTIALAAACFAANAQNPIITGMFAPDPAPYVHDGKVYLFVDHDEPDATFYFMKDWHVFSTEDMVNWTHLGAQVSTATFDWAVQGDNAWASQAVEVGGKWYWYLSIIEKATRAQVIAVAVADNPMGPWKDAIGGPLAKGEGSFIDPTVFVDDDGRAYLFWGNKGCWYGELNPDMISFKNGFKEVPGFHDPKCFGPAVMKMNWGKGEMEMMVGYEEGPWVMKRNGIYYMSYPAGGVPEHMAYSTAKNINGPWTTATRSWRSHLTVSPSMEETSISRVTTICSTTAECFLTETATVAAHAWRNSSSILTAQSRSSQQRQKVWHL